MVLILHVAAAFTSLAYTVLLYVRPSTAKFRVSYGLIGITIASGTYLIVNQKAHMLQACLMGIAYLGVTLAGVIAAHGKFAAQTDALRSHKDQQ